MEQSDLLRFAITALEGLAVPYRSEKHLRDITGVLRVSGIASITPTLPAGRSEWVLTKFGMLF